MLRRPGIGPLGLAARALRRLMSGCRAARPSRSCPASSTVPGGSRISRPRFPLGCSDRGRAGGSSTCAPGRKTLQLAAAGWQVTSLDRSTKRVGRLRANLARTALEADVVVADALAWTPGAQFDAILLDAPCTATGTARRHPDVLHRIGSRQIAEMAELQARLLERAARWLVPEGRLVYAVCSLEREEGEEQVPRVALAADPIAPEELP